MNMHTERNIHVHVQTDIRIHVHVQTDRYRWCGQKYLKRISEIYQICNIALLIDGQSYGGNTAQSNHKSDDPYKHCFQYYPSNPATISIIFPLQSFGMLFSHVPHKHNQTRGVTT